MAQLPGLAHGITHAEVIAKFKAMPIVDVQALITDGREFVLSRPHPARGRSPQAAGPAADVAPSNHRQASPAPE